LGYNLRDNEIIVIQSLLNAEYFEGLVPAEINSYAKYNSYDTAEPIISQNYENRTSINEALNPMIGEELRECVPVSTGKISSITWKKCFPGNFDELMYENTTYCGFYMLIDIVNRSKGILLTVSELKNILLEEYVKYLINYEGQVIDILISEGKKTLGDQVKAGTLSFQNFIYTDSYFITNFDIWLIMERYQIPCIIISSITLAETDNKKKEFVVYGDAGDDFVFIISPGFRAENIPKYKIVQSNEKNIFLPITVTSCQEVLNDAIRDKKSIEYLLSNYRREKTTQYKPKNPNPKPRIKKIFKLKLNDDNDAVDVDIPQEDILGQALEEGEDIIEEPEQQAKEAVVIDNNKSRKKRSNVIIEKKTKTKKIKPVKLVLENP
jgi:hypothetical protein